ncbi:MAG: hypothetical protein SFV15_19605 [Polyangiaceae bacterium]|nr:hypothetical protein [Polyangiaceae bacterium]
MPVDFGNLYAENLAWGVAYTAVELSLLTPVVWLTGGHMNHGGDDTRRWSDGERNTVIGDLSAYVVVKLVAGLHAGYSARQFNAERKPTTMILMAPTAGGALVSVGRSF